MAILTDYFKHIEIFYKENRETLLESKLRPSKSITRDIFVSVKKFIEKKSLLEKGVTIEEIAEEIFGKAGINDTVRTNIRVMEEFHFLEKKTDTYYTTEIFRKFLNSGLSIEEYLENLLLNISSSDSISMLLNSIICTLREGYLEEKIIEFPEDAESFKKSITDINERQKLREKIKYIYGFNGSPKQSDDKDYTPNANYRILTPLKNLGYIIPLENRNILGLKSYILTPKSIKVLKKIDDNLNFLVNNSSIQNSNENLLINKPHQRIFFGAPGTGKSYLLNEDAKKYFGNDYERVTFHPNYMYGNFIGTFKPFPVKLEDGKETIMYKYIPGVLLRLLIKAIKNKAIKNPATNYLLIIEEINRANTAAVFGDFFQLLDRNGNGESEYGIAVSEDLKLYLEEQFDKNNLTENEKRYLGEKLDKITLPPNFYIWATMNSADQGVMPLDTAFKRRWEFEYTGIDDAYNKSKDESGKSEFDDYKFRANENELANWNDFRVKINEILSKCHVPEDKLLGPYFVSKSILASKDIDKITNTIKNKVLMYLYEDAGRQHRKRIFKEGKWETYSKLCEAFDENCEEIFNDKVELPGKTPIEKAEEINEGIKEQTKESEEQSQKNETEITETTESANE